MGTKPTHLSKPKRRDKSLVVRGIAFHRYQWTWLKRKAKAVGMGQAWVIRGMVDACMEREDVEKARAEAANEA